jgi:hypothetical protein
MTTYRSSDGREHVISDMANGHLHNALARLVDGDEARGSADYRREEREALLAEVVRRAEAEDVTLLSDDELVARYRRYDQAPWKGALDKAFAAIRGEAARRDAARGDVGT